MHMVTHAQNTRSSLSTSVTAGHNGGGEPNAYPRRFIDWLNAKHPCISTNSSIKSEHIYQKSNAADSLSHFPIWSSVTDMDKIDLVIVEFNIGDSFCHQLPHALENKGSMAENMGE